jgi:hypothetical protein
MLFLQGFGFDFGDLEDILDGLLQDFLAYLLAILQFIWSVLVFVANYIWAALNWIANFFYTLFQDIQKGLKWIWENVIKSGLTKLITLFQKVRAWLSSFLKPVVDFLKKVRAWYDWMFNHFWKPILNMIGILRKILTIFRLLGFKWAARLDGDLAMIEEKIVQIYTTLRGYINTAITWIDLIIDPTGILRRNPLFAAIFQSSNELRNVLLTVPTRPLTGGEMDQQTADRNSMTLAQQKSDFQNYYSQGQLPPDMAQSQKDCQAYLDALLNGTSIPESRPNGF